MPLLRLKEIREMSSEKRNEKLKECRLELAKIRALVRVSASVENPSRVKEIKRAIARILTVRNEEGLGVTSEK